MNEKLGMNYDGVKEAESKSENAERQFQLLWDKYRQFHDSTPIGYFTLDADNVILAVNMSGARLLGTAREKLLGRELEDFIPAPSESCFHSLPFLSTSGQ